MTPELAKLLKTCPVEEIPVASIRRTLPIRAARSPERVDQIADWLTSGVDVPPIWVTRATHQLIDGDHRVEVHTYLEADTIKAVMFPEAERATLIGWAVQANTGGSLEMKPIDFQHTADMLITAGMLQRDIAVHLATASGLTVHVVRSYIRQMNADRAQERLVQAARAVTNEDMKPSKAAETFGVDADRLREYLRSTTEPETWLRKIDRVYESFGKGLGTGIIRPLVERVDDGTLSAAYAERCLLRNLDRARRVVKNQEAHLVRFRGRFNNIKDSAA